MKIDISSPKEIHELKSSVVEKAWIAAQKGQNKEVTAYKGMMEILVSAESQYNLAREEQLEKLKRTLDSLEVELNRLMAENEELQNRILTHEKDEDEENLFDTLDISDNIDIEELTHAK